MHKNSSTNSQSRPLELWGGLECTVNRVRDDYFSQLDRNGHASRFDDIARFAALGIRAIRYPVLWERTAPDGLSRADWSWADERLRALRDAGVTPIAGLVHHGSGPRHTSLLDPAFAPQLAEYAGAVAARYPWLEYYTPVNEPCTTARFAGLYGLWYPHGRDDRTFIQALLNQCRAVVLSMRAIRAVNPNARLVQTDDLGKTYSTPEMADVAEFYNLRRWLAWDLLCGRVGTDHALWDYLTRSGIDAAEILWFRDNPCPPDIVGVNYYVTSERWLDHRPERYPPHHRGVIDGRPCADIETSRALATPTPGIAPLLTEVWERYRLPIAVTEAHIDANREDQLRWLLEIWEAAHEARLNGVDMRAVTVWALLGSFDWNSLVTECRGYYEPGPFDVRSTPPRPTAVAAMMRELSSGRQLSHPVLRGQGWWRRPGRFLCHPPVATSHVPASISADGHTLVGMGTAPLLITGATGTLGRAFARICAKRNIAYRLLSRQDMDIADPASVERALAQHRPWAVINTSGYVRVDEAEIDAERCFRENAVGPAVLAAACARHGVHLTTFSSDLVFDGARREPYVESDPVAPLNVYGKSKVEAEERVLDANPDALVVRTSSFFGPWDKYNFVTLALDALGRGEPFAGASDITVTPTYVPDLVHTCLDLAIDRERGIWHLTNGPPVTWAGLAVMAAERAGVDASRVEARPAHACGFAAARPAYTALTSERAILLPTLDNALGRYLELRNEADPEIEELEMAAETRQHVASDHRQQEEAPAEAFHVKRF
ncbi:sugar nucleotide-binding protein [Massilia solisilvae]|uniref:dTDP-4-dehydrorhamnose reductase n=1 Tax=Massilia solisilvae TaxID=1811225 RepID=A0ABT2BKQ3_9BURK|nr:family 1 glycosylhydrolase [Massilia solisilvae]MCS0608463.1 sugar nucleotide-binding protein [Massilia solisilvae]